MEVHGLVPLAFWSGEACMAFVLILVLPLRPLDFWIFDNPQSSEGLLVRKDKYFLSIPKPSYKLSILTLSSSREDHDHMCLRVE